jgi:hypothetical protein
MKSKGSSADKRLLLRIIDEAYEKKAWHGPNLRGSLRGVTAAQAARRPAPGRHCIRDIVLHAAYWKYAVRRRLVGGKRGSFPVEGSNWFGGPSTLRASAWKQDLALLGKTHRELRSAIVSLPSGLNLNRRAPGAGSSYVTLIFGVAAHDLYHAGQIQLLKRLQKGRRKR